MAALVGAAGAACVIAFEGRADFTATHRLDDVETVQLFLPPTDLEVVGHVGSDELSYEGAWYAIGGTAADARESAELPALVFERVGGIARLRAEIPFSVDGLVELMLGRVDLDSGVDLQIEGSGDVHVNDVLGHVSVRVADGAVEIYGADGAFVSTGVGDVELRVGDHVEASSERGDVTVQQTGMQKDVLASAAHGDVTVTLSNDENVDLAIAAGGEIRIDTEQITSISDGTFARTLGTGEVHVYLEASGDVIVEDLYEPDDDGETGSETGSDSGSS